MVEVTKDSIFNAAPVLYRVLALFPYCYMGALRLYGAGRHSEMWIGLGTFRLVRCHTKFYLEYKLYI
jgi:hypothetical protein